MPTDVMYDLHAPDSDTMRRCVAAAARRCIESDHNIQIRLDGQHVTILRTPPLPVEYAIAAWTEARRLVAPPSLSPCLHGALWGRKTGAS